MASSAGNREYWGILMPMPADALSGLAQQAEAQGLTGVFAPQVQGAPWPTLAAAAVGTSTLQFASGIAIASVRSPFETAITAIDMDRITSGRFILGLGASVHSWTEGIFGIPKRKPLTDLKECVEVVRYVVANAHKGLEPFEGEYYKATFEEHQPTAPPVREEIPIWTAAMRGPAVRVAGEVADGLMGHPMWSLQWARDQVSQQLEEGLRKSGRSRQDIHVDFWPWTAPNEDVKQAIDDARPSIAFYAGIKQYESFFDAHGFADQARKIQPLIQESKFVDAAAYVTDEMVQTFVAVGTDDEIRTRIDEWWEISDSLCPLPPTWGLDPAVVYGYQERIGALIAS